MTVIRQFPLLLGRECFESGFFSQLVDSLAVRFRQLDAKQALRRLACEVASLGINNPLPDGHF